MCHDHYNIEFVKLCIKCGCHHEDLCKCKHKRGWHHAKATIKNPSICYGIGCMCAKYE